ncbi:hypothetical protein AN958_01753 [Leucoagaricus sp. SymC.cos]|nr:hypothetical protein AN958_01753 [Leucoagaricus sp. SymC.cos]
MKVPDGRLSPDSELIFGLGKEAREKHINWLIQVPKRRQPDSDDLAEHDQFLPSGDLESSVGSFSSTSSAVSCASRSYHCFDMSRQNLINQLTTSPETRFHAAWMFLRFHLLLGPKRPLQSATDEQPASHDSAKTWDITLATLAISVKFHRDFLFPLAPIEAADYMDISPHGMSYEDFEHAQRTVLNTFSYELGITPQPLLDQIRIALPSLQELLDFEGGWNQVQKETWRLLFGSLYAPDVMQFSVSVLTTTALTTTLVFVLAQYRYYKSDWNDFFNFTSSADQGQEGLGIPKKFGIAAKEDAEGVILDILSTVGVSEVSHLTPHQTHYMTFLGGGFCLSAVV